MKYCVTVIFATSICKEALFLTETASFRFLKFVQFAKLKAFNIDKISEVTKKRSTEKVIVTVFF